MCNVVLKPSFVKPLVANRSENETKAIEADFAICSDSFAMSTGSLFCGVASSSD